jgi:shikimate dehydrogenase
MSETNLFAVAGRPVLHSLSPRIFSFLFSKCGLNAVYLRLSESGGDRIVETARALGLKGFNVTAPAKSEILPGLDELSKESEIIQAVNTISVDKTGKLTGHNTDWMGVVSSLRAAGLDPAHKKAVVLGAGGAGRAAAYGLLKSGAAGVVLVNRTEAKGKAAAQRLGAEYRPMASLPQSLAEADILVSCVSGPEALISPEWLPGDLTLLEADYRYSPLSKTALEKGCRTIGGRDWLIWQALPSFRLMTGVKPPESVPLISRYIEEKLPQKTAVSLIGFMGSGKTTVGRHLAGLLSRPFIDSDAVIEDEYATSIENIFSSQGEARFRKIESKVIRKLLLAAGGSVLALGGGSVLDARNRDLIRRHTTAVWLWSSLRNFKKVDYPGRPLLNVDIPERKAESLLKNRIPLYARSCDLVLCTDPFDAEEIASRIKDEVDQTF